MRPTYQSARHATTSSLQQSHKRRCLQALPESNMTTEPFWERIPHWTETQTRRDPRPTEISGAEAGLPASGTHRRIIFDYLKKMGSRGVTSDECSRYLDLHHGKDVSPNQVASRMGELLHVGLIVDSGKTRKTRRGGNAIVWVYKGSL